MKTLRLWLRLVLVMLVTQKLWKQKTLFASVLWTLGTLVAVHSGLSSDIVSVIDEAKVL